MVYTSLLMGGASKVQGVYLSALWAADLREFNCTVVMRISSKRIPSEPGLRVYTRINIEKGSETDNIPTESFSWRRETSVLALALFTRSRVRVQITAARGGRRASLPLRNPRPTFCAPSLLEASSANVDHTDFGCRVGGKLAGGLKKTSE